MLTLPSWLVIGVVTFVVTLGGGWITDADKRWFRRLRRPAWLTFEWAIPLIWTVILICGAWSANVVWQQAPGTGSTWILMASYLLLEVVIIAYVPITLRLRSLKIGTWVGGLGFVIGLGLAIGVYPISLAAALLLVPYLLWSPIGTYTTWQMVDLNP